MNKFPPGPWKENRQGAVSLCYLGLEPNALEMVLAHHAAVGIRASLVCGAVEPLLSVPAERNWDLLADREDTDLLTALARIDGHADRGVYFPGEAVAGSDKFLYQLSAREDVIPAPHSSRVTPHSSLNLIPSSAPDVTQPLPSFPAPADVSLVLDWIEAVVQKGRGLILRIDTACISEMGPDQHRRLLQRLGDHHARIWCAPIRDIALFRHA